ncbi:hypothetical protein Q0590_33965 [Rhodocytophaga aerolata]|uniref:SlyX family protein n=1 Tax=Rhodocytophaga aerolata TaxID=455078 RepID=A0ABT8RHY1_9BACT|nr:hypothetical protein [Rhodocytophaga aerolata]MDO1451331.1 hypothetical protein [Rhodocytophaga aerolata]
MEKEQFTMQDWLSQLDLTSTCLKKQIDLIKEDMEGLDQFMAEHRKLTQERSSLYFQQPNTNSY